MNREMRRKDRQVSTEAARSILKECVWGVLSTVGTDSCPYGVPVNYVVLDDAIYIHCAPSGHKLDNIRHCAQVSFTAVNGVQTLPAAFSTAYASAIATGTAHEATGEEKLLALQAFIEKYAPESAAEGAQYIARAADATTVLRINIETLTGKAHKIPE